MCVLLKGIMVEEVEMSIHYIFYTTYYLYSIYNIYIYTNTMGHLELEKDIYITPCVTCTRVMC